MATAVTVEMGETGLLRAGGARGQACGLGACVGLCLFETETRAAALVHVILPETLAPASGRAPAAPGKCADTAVAHALSELARAGGRAERVTAALVGGAQIFTAAGAGAAHLSRLEVGARTLRALREELARAGVPLCAEETGGHSGRTVTLEAGTGNVWVRPVGMPERLLVSLGRQPLPAAPPLPAAQPLPAASGLALGRLAAYAH